LFTSEEDDRRLLQKVILPPLPKVGTNAGGSIDVLYAALCYGSSGKENHTKALIIIGIALLYGSRHREIYR
jgi:hypothetical protein